MSELSMPVLSETLAVLGRNSGAASLALRETLRFKTRSGSLLVQDAAGRGATILSPANKMGLERRRVVWVDLADRRRPVSFFQLRRSAHLRPLWARVLRSIRHISKSSIGDGTLDWAAEAAYALSSDGSVGLGALFRCLSSAETRRWFLETGNEPSDLGALLDMLAWALSFAAVYAISEGENRGNLLDALDRPSVVWIESPVEHFEPKEHLLVQVLVEAAIEEALRTMAYQSEQWTDTLKGLTVLHLYPAAPVALSLEAWVRTHLGAVRHIGVHRLEPEVALPPLALSWVEQSECVWLAGPPGPMRPECHSKWLSGAEMTRVQELAKGELWVRSNVSGKAIVTRLRDWTAFPGLSAELRSRACRRRRISSLSQIAAAVKSLASPTQAHRDLYARLCEIESLRMGWLRVRESKGRTAGVDSVTAASFAGQVEAELARLSAELRSGQYRPRPLRRIQIPKPDGGVRNLGVACVRDRIVQAAALSLLEPIFEPTFSRFSFAFRPGRSAHQAVALARSMIAAGRSWVVISDIRKCFDTIDHCVLIGLLAKRIADDELIRLVQRWITVDVLEFPDLLPSELGVPQGEALSPLLANIYLDPLDRHFEQLGIAFVRYADDVVLFAQNEEGAKDACRQLADFLREALHLELKPAKTAYVPVVEGFDFLGFRITGDSITIKPERAEEFIGHLSESIQVLGASAAVSSVKTAETLARINSVVRGWRNYFLLAGEPALESQMRELDARIDQTASFHLPEGIRENPAWLCRERLSASPAGESEDSQQSASARRAQPGTGYPEASSAETPPGWTSSPERPADPQPSAHTNGRGSALRKPDVSPTATTLEDGDRLYVLTHGAYVAVAGDDVILKKRRVEFYRRPMNQIGLIYLHGLGINVSVEAQVRLAEHNIPVVLSQPLGTPMAVVNSIETSRSSIRRLQAIRRDDPDVVRTGMAMIACKVGNQAAVLKYFAKYRKRIDPEAAAAMMEAAEKVLVLSHDIGHLDPGEANVRGSIMGFEGHAAAIYWGQLAALVPQDLGFGGRITLSAQDPVNQCLNYVYGILYGEVWRAVVKAGLDPYFGLVHGSVRDQGSLVFDLIEELRAPFGDRLVLSMLGRGFRPEVGQRGLLRTRSKGHLVRTFAKRWAKPIQFRSNAVSPGDLLQGQANSLAAVFQREGTYHPYRMRW
jgi:RNA-directed DNA polymerase